MVFLDLLKALTGRKTDADYRAEAIERTLEFERSKCSDAVNTLIQNTLYPPNKTRPVTNGKDHQN